MVLSTKFTQLFGVRHPIALAPMGGSPVARWRRPSLAAAGWDAWRW